VIDLFKQKKYNEAFKLFDKTIELNPNDFET
jgi:tetratricopeptide (TPR) repeat protein